MIYVSLLVTTKQKNKKKQTQKPTYIRYTKDKKEWKYPIIGNHQITKQLENNKPNGKSKSIPVNNYFTWKWSQLSKQTGCCWWDASIGWKVKENLEIWGSFSAKSQVTLYLAFPPALYVHWLARILVDPYRELKSGPWVHCDISAPLCVHDLFGGTLYVLREQEQSVDHLWTVWFDWLVDCFFHFSSIN